MNCKYINKPVYAIIDSGVFGFRIVSGIVTGVRYTEKEPTYSIQFGSNQWWTPLIAETKEELIELFELPSLEEVNKKNGLKINFKDK